GQRQATLEMTGLVHGQKKELSLCRPCAARLGWKAGEGSLWDSLFESFLPGPSLFDYPTQVRQRSPAPRVCPACGQTETQLQETGLLGCSQCYETFAQRLAPVFGRVHGHSRHLDRPLILEEGKTQDKLTRLRQALASAVDKEAYEEAARIRDEIRQLEADQVSEED
ncbi:MAG TPA: UvrB/UvrC motif-containing protein, partial [Clostridia bacterium]|nr:UvrB/UvrC motif-containing protein [Clostridia bacterium]